MEAIKLDLLRNQARENRRRRLKILQAKRERRTTSGSNSLYITDIVKDKPTVDSHFHPSSEFVRVEPSHSVDVHTPANQQDIPATLLRRALATKNRLKRKRIRQKSSAHPPKDRRKGISPDYKDMGNPTKECHACHALLWSNEAKRGYRTWHNKSYGLCCLHGKAEIPPLRKPPETLKRLYKGEDKKSKHFLYYIRRYNMMFAFTSMGGKVDTSVNRGHGPYTYRMHGQNYHSHGSLLPEDGAAPKFAQLYIYDTENETRNRLNCMRYDAISDTDFYMHLKLCYEQLTHLILSSSPNSEKPKGMDNEFEAMLATDLQEILDANNELVKIYRMVRDRYTDNAFEEIKLRLVANRATDGRVYNLPTASEIAMLIVGDVDEFVDKRDIIVETKSGRLKRINELHPSYIPLQYPLFFPYGEDGYRPDIAHKGVVHIEERRQTRLTMREFFAYRIQHRRNEYSLLLHGRRLFQQFLVDAYTMVESERLTNIRTQQPHLRCNSYDKLRKSLDNGQTEACSTGKRVILPSSFTGGTRYTMHNYLDAMALCKWYGYPDLFITFTCNPKWPEITRHLRKKGLRPEDRPDVISRLFKQKLDQLMCDLKKQKLFGRVKAGVYTVEFQKRGLPHAHICLFLHEADKLPTPQHIDKVICAEIPDKETEPALYELVSEFMMHGPCGFANKQSPCMKLGRCSKNFPKKTCDQTTVDQNGYPLYRRRVNGRFVQKNGTNLDNGFVVPYNSFLLKRYQAHINVEWCNQAGSIKYLFKYITKGPDRVTLAVCQQGKKAVEDKDELNKDEIKEYYDCRYISACEASWRIFSFDIHYRTPSVERLSFHLDGEQPVVYDGEENLNTILAKPSIGFSMFTSWMERNKVDREARELTYVQFPTKYVWHPTKRKWAKRKRGFAIGRIHYVPPATGEAYFLRILLNIVKGPKSYEEIRTVNKVDCGTFREACYNLGLLEDDREYIEAIKEASFWGTGNYLRFMFVTLLLSHSLSRPTNVWKETWKLLSDDIANKISHLPSNKGSQHPEDMVHNHALLEIEEIMNRNGSSLHKFPEMPYPDADASLLNKNALIQNQLLYDRESLANEHQHLMSSLTIEQKGVYNTIMESVEKDSGGIYFIYGHGGTGKTYIWKTLSAAIRSKGHIVLTVASSGIASLLLTGGCTAHSRFAIPINVNEDSVCSIPVDSDLSQLLKETKLIIWDEAPMIHRHCFEALDRTLTDILNTPNSNSDDKPFGGKVVVFGGDFRQILPVVPKGSRQDIVHASLCSSKLWHHCKVLRLTLNMRLRAGSDPTRLREIEDFADWILRIGDGVIGGDNDGQGIVQMPDDMLIKDTKNPIQSIVEFVYPGFINQLKNDMYFEQCAILAPTNEVVSQINDYMLDQIPGGVCVYLSSDSLCNTENHNPVNEALCSPDVLNSIKLSGIPDHQLKLKIGALVMLLRNLDQSLGLCNGTRMRVLNLGKRVIEAEIISGNNIGARTFIPRIRLTPSDKRMPFKFNRKQFPLTLCFAMTINKSQGQSLSRVGLFLPRPVFSHGQLYVALSRVTTKEGIKVLITDDEGNVSTTTNNVVYKEVLQNL